MKEVLLAAAPQSKFLVFLMLIYTSVDLNELFRLGKKYPWIKPSHCPKCCGIRVWSHGYAHRLFDGYYQPLFVKRYRCPDCISVHTCRPETHQKFVQAPRLFVFFSLLLKITLNSCLPILCHSRQRHWLRNFKHQSCRQSNIDFDDIYSSLFALFTEFFGGMTVVLVCIEKFWFLMIMIALHLSFLVTDCGPSP